MLPFRTLSFMNFNEIFQGKTLIIGVGNRLRSDDGVGPVLADKLSEAGFTNVLDVGAVPENYTKIIKDYSPDTILIIDALSFDVLPGTWKLYPIEQCSEHGFSTHNAPISLFTSYLRHFLNVKILLLGIQPASIEYHEGLSPELENTVCRLVEQFKEIQKSESTTPV